MKKILIILIVGLILISSSFVNASPNPASIYCGGLGYKTRTEETGKGQIGICIFPEGSECRAWSYYCKCMHNGLGCESSGSGNFSCDYPCKEAPCKKAGESSYVFGCCEGLKSIEPIKVYDENCNYTGWIGWTEICSDCGNNICEEWESICNCPEDCEEKSKMKPSYVPVAPIEDRGIIEATVLKIYEDEGYVRGIIKIDNIIEYKHHPDAEWKNLSENDIVKIYFQWDNEEREISRNIGNISITKLEQVNVKDKIIGVINGGPESEGYIGWGLFEYKIIERKIYPDVYISDSIEKCPESHNPMIKDDVIYACIDTKSVEKKGGTAFVKDGLVEWCEDTDKGLKYYKKGEVTVHNMYFQKGRIFSMEDMCEKKDILTEFFCSADASGSISEKYKDCKYGCEEGKCVRFFTYYKNKIIDEMVSILSKLK